MKLEDIGDIALMEYKSVKYFIFESDKKELLIHELCTTNQEYDKNSMAYIHQ